MGRVVETETWIVFLRAINVGNRRMKMAELRAAYVESGFADTSTHLASGNVILRSEAPPERDAVEQVVGSRFGFDSEAFIRSGADVVGIVESNPFGDGLVEVSFLHDRPTPAQVTELEATATAPEALRVIGREVFFLREGKGVETVHKESTTMAVLGQSTTRRGLRTISQIADRYVR